MKQPQRSAILLGLTSSGLLLLGVLAVAAVWARVGAGTDRIAWVAALGVWLQALAVIVAFVVAYSQLTEARRLRLETTRPFVVVTLECRVVGIANLVIRNIGPTMARDVQFSFDEPLKRATIEAHSGAETVLRHGLPSLAPGQEIRTVFELGVDRMRVAKADAPLPDRWELKSSYIAPDGREFDDRHVLDLAPYLSIRFSDPKGLPHIYSELEKIRKTLERQTGQVAQLQLSSADDQVAERPPLIERVRARLTRAS